MKDIVTLGVLHDFVNVIGHNESTNQCFQSDLPYKLKSKFVVKRAAKIRYANFIDHIIYTFQYLAHNTFQNQKTFVFKPLASLRPFMSNKPEPFNSSRTPTSISNLILIEFKNRLQSR